MSEPLPYASATSGPHGGEVDWPVRKLRQVRRARWLSGCGGLSLVSSFFLPAVPVCNSALVPAEEWLDFFDGRGLPAADDLAVGFLILGAPYLFGALVAILALRSRTYRRRTERSLGLSVSWLTGSAAVILTGLLVVDVIHNGVDGGWVIWALVAGVALAYWLRSMRMGPAGLLCARWLAALSTSLWFAAWVLFGDALYGIWVSLFGSLAILAGTTAEAAARNPQGPWATLSGLLRCRYAMHDLEGDRCLRCGYLLIGLTSRRCPECGEPFTTRASDPAP